MAFGHVKPHIWGSGLTKGYFFGSAMPGGGSSEPLELRLFRLPEKAATRRTRQVAR